MPPPSTPARGLQHKQATQGTTHMWSGGTRPTCFAAHGLVDMLAAGHDPIGWTLCGRLPVSRKQHKWGYTETKAQAYLHRTDPTCKDGALLLYPHIFLHVS